MSNRYSYFFNFLKFLSIFSKKFIFICPDGRVRIHPKIPYGHCPDGLSGLEIKYCLN